MPVYEYAPDSGKCGKCSGKFEIFQKMTDPPIEVCPHCGQKCHRLISQVSSRVNKLSNADLARAGFTKYVRRGKGCYEKVYGRGPNLNPPS